MEPEIEAAVKWWVEQLRAPYNAEELAPSYHFRLQASAHARMTLPPLTEEALARFAQTLRILLRARVREWGPPEQYADRPVSMRPSLDLSTEYHGPLDDLAAAATLANIPENAFPWKASLYLSRGEVAVFKAWDGGRAVEDAEWMAIYQSTFES